jgi:hypothetical protein
MGRKPAVATSLADSGAAFFADSSAVLRKKIKHGPEKNAFQTLKG